MAKAFRYVSRLTARSADILDPKPPAPPPPPPEPPPPAPTLKELAHARWVTDCGDNTLRVNYAIQPSEIVIDLGGYEGQWASDIYARYLCTVHIVEPVAAYAANIRSRFKQNKQIHLHQCALGGRSGSLMVSVSGDASSAFKESGHTEFAPMFAFSDWVQNIGVDEIALLKINIEGGEYELMDHLISSGVVNRIRDIQIQFHDFVTDSDARMKRIQEGLESSHRLTYQYPYVWENWRRKGWGQID